MSKPNSRDWMPKAYCRGKEPEQWSTDSRRGPMQNYAKRLCAPCTQHRQCAAYALSIPNSPPIGVVIAGVAVPSDTSDERYPRAIKKLEIITAGGVLPHVAN